MRRTDLRAARANRVFVFLVRRRNIRTKNTVTDKSNNGLGLSLFGIVVPLQSILGAP